MFINGGGLTTSLEEASASEMLGWVLEFKPDGTLLQCDGALGFVIHMSPPGSGFFTISFTYNDGTSVMWQSDGTSLQSCAVRKSKDGDLGDRNTQADHSVIERFADGRTIRRSASGWIVERG